MPIQEPVVVLERALVLVPRLIQRKTRIPALPEHVMEAVERDLAQHEEVPGLLPGQSPTHLEPSLGHLEYLVQHDVVAGPPEVRDVEDVLVPITKLGHDLGLELRGEGPRFRRRRREEAADPPPGEIARRRVRGRKSYTERAHTSGAERIPHGR